MDYQTALVHAELGDLEAAERFAPSIDGACWHRLIGTFAEILRATVHVRAGEPGGPMDPTTPRRWPVRSGS